MTNFKQGLLNGDFSDTNKFTYITQLSILLMLNSLMKTCASLWSKMLLIIHFCGYYCNHSLICGC